MEKQRLSFYNEIARNKRNSFFLIIGIFLVFLLFGYVISMAMGPDYFFIIMIISIVISISYILISYYNSDKIALASVNAQPASRTNHKQYYDLVEGLTLASGMPMPKLYIMKDESINAFASGRDPKNSVICVTTGILNKLSKQELEGVLAHELSHIANYDIRFMTITAVMVGLIAIISEIFLRSLFWSNLGGDRDNKNVIFILIGIALAILAPILVMLVQLAISRKREYAADSTAVKFTRTPTGLIGALTKIKNNSEMRVSGAVAPLFLAKPNKTRELFQTHPNIEDRIEKLRKM